MAFKSGSLIIILLALLHGVGAPVSAQQGALDVVLLVDSSGSMLVTDPLNLRKEGSRLFVSLMESVDNLALVSFDRQAEVRLPLAALDRAAFDRSLLDLKSEGRYTDLGVALEKSVELLEQGGRKDATKIIVLLSDGRFDPHPERGSASTLTLSLVEGLLPAAMAKGIKVHTLSFSPQADQELLEKIALKTGGMYWHTPTAEDVHRSFADLLLSAKKPQLLAMRQREVFIDELVEEATFYIDRQASLRVSVLDPAGTAFSSVVNNASLRWFEGKNFDVVTIQDPLAGTWKIQGADLVEGFVAVLTKLRLHSNWPSYVFVDEPILLEVQLYDGDTPLALSSMNALVDYEMQITSTDVIAEPLLEGVLTDDGKAGDRIANDGIFSRLISINKLGGYHLKLIARSPTFERTQLLPFQVRPSMISLSKRTEDEVTIFSVEVDDQGEKLSSQDVVLVAKHDGVSYEIPLSNQAKNNYIGTDEALKANREYLVSAYLRAKNRQGVALEVESKILKHVKIETIVLQQPIAKVEAEPPAPKTNPLPFFITTLLLNGVTAVAGFLFVRGKVSFSNTDPSIPKLPQNLEEILKSIEDRASMSEVDFADPYYRVQKAEALIAADPVDSEQVDVPNPSPEADTSEAEEERASDEGSENPDESD